MSAEENIGALEPSHATADEFLRAAELVGAVVGAKTNGEALGLLLDYRYDLRKAAFTQARCARLRDTLSDREIDAIADSMPGGLNGFCKGWGWRQYARAIEAAVHGDKSE